MAGVIDTGNLWGTPLHASSFPPDDSTQIDTLSGTAPNGYEWEVGVYRVPLAFPSGWRRKKMVVREAGGKPYRLQAGFGADLWNGGTLVLDGQNRWASAKGGNESAQTHGS
jgi:hypothetical protein